MFPFFSCISNKSNYLAGLPHSYKVLGSVLRGLEGSLCGDRGRFPAADQTGVCFSCDVSPETDW